MSEAATFSADTTSRDSLADEVRLILRVPSGRSVRRSAGLWDHQPLIRRGLPVRSLDAVAERLGVGMGELAAVLRTTTRSIDRWRAREARLSETISDRLYRVAYVIALAETVFADREKARQWMSRPNRALRHATPFDSLDNEVGARHVEEVLVRLRHGVFG